MNRRLVVIAAICVAILESKGKSRERIIEAIQQERDSQDNQWGGREHDKTHSYITWLLILMKHIGKLSRSIQEPADRDMRNFRDSIIMIGQAATEEL
jgi:hypothetical protein